MGRGLGKIQREVLATLREHQRSGDDPAGGVDTLELTSRIFLGHPRCGYLTTAAQQVSVRRALAALARDELVIKLGTMGRGHRCHWRAGLWAIDPG